MSSIQGSLSSSNVATVNTKQTLTNKTIELDSSNLLNLIPVSGSKLCITSGAIHHQLGLKQNIATAFDGAYSSLTGRPTIDTNITNGSANAVTSNAVFDALQSIPVSKFNYDANIDIKDVALVATANSIDMISEGGYFLQMDNITNRNNQTHNIGFFLKAPITTNYATSNMKDVFRINKENTSGDTYDNDKWEGYINEDKIVTISSTAMSNKQDNLDFDGPPSNNSNPSTSAQIKAYTENNFQAKNNLVYTSTNGFLGLNVTPQRAFDFGTVRVGFGNNKTGDGNQGIYWGSEAFDYRIAREAGAWSGAPNYRKLAIQWATGIRFGVDSSVAIQGNVAYTNTSDNRCKHNEEPITNALETINKLHVLKYNKTDIYDPSGNVYPEDYNLSEEELKTTKYGVECGIIAQSLLEIPELKFCVHEHGDDEFGNKAPYSVNYESIHNILIAAVQQLSQELTILKAQISKE